MMDKSNVIDYLKNKGRYNFKLFQINEIDLAILASFSYVDFMSVDAFKQSDLYHSTFNCNHLLVNEKILSTKFNGGRLAYKEFISVLLRSERFKDMKISKVVNVYNENNNVQFFAFLVSISDINIIIFRGTDNTVVGFKEDLLTNYDKPILSQSLALSYLNNVLYEIEGDIYIAGHSKGGNLAYYSFFNTTTANKRRIIKCCNFDGNGFKNDKYPYNDFNNQLLKIVTDNSLVGFIFDNCHQDKIVKSLTFGLQAHDIINWNINSKKYNEFKKVNNYSHLSLALKFSLDKWLNQIPEQNINIFIDFLFMLGDINKPKTVEDLKSSIANNVELYIESLRNYPKKDKKIIRKLLNDLIKEYIRCYFQIKRNRIKSLIKESN